jgi:hypothetical protein
MRHRLMPSLTQLTVSAVSSLILPCPKKLALTRICSFLTRTTTSPARTAAPHPSGCSSQEQPRLPLFVPTTSTTTPEGCVRGGESWGGGFFVAFLGFDATSDDGTGNAGRFARTTAPHIAQSTAAHLFSAQVQVLHCQRWQEEASMVEGCVSCVHSLFVPSALAGSGDWVRHKLHPGRTRACWGLSESSLQRENTCGLVLRPRCSRSGEMRGERLMST